MLASAAKRGPLNLPSHTAIALSPLKPGSSLRRALRPNPRLMKGNADPSDKLDPAAVFSSLLQQTIEVTQQTATMMANMTGLQNQVNLLDTAVRDPVTGLATKVNMLDTKVNLLDTKVNLLDTAVRDPVTGLVTKVNLLDTAVRDPVTGLVTKLAALSATVEAGLSGSKTRENWNLVLTAVSVLSTLLSQKDQMLEVIQKVTAFFSNTSQ